jgi:hypothetical protein
MEEGGKRHLADDVGKGINLALDRCEREKMHLASPMKR